MLQFFKNKTKPEAAIAEMPTITPKVYSSEIEQIHHEFETAGDTLLSESIAILGQCTKVDKEKGKLLTSVGFINTREAKIVSEAEQKEKDATTMAELVRKYQFAYPNNKFITESMVAQICKKYGLVCGSVELYKGFVPKDKLEMIKKFSLKKEDVPLFYVREADGSIVAPKFNPLKNGTRTFDKEGCAYEHLCSYSNKKGVYHIRTFYGDDRGHSERARITFDEVGLKICAPLKDMETKGMELKGYHLVKHIPDPVVLQPVAGGYLIVTAWGDEASDENVVNPINN